MKPLTALPNGADAGWEMGKGFTWAWPEVAPQARGLRSWPKIAAALRYTPAVGGDFALQAAPTDDGKQTAMKQHKSHPTSPCHGHRCPSWMLTGPMGKAAAFPPLPRQNRCRRAGLGFTRCPPPVWAPLHRMVPYAPTDRAHPWYPKGYTQTCSIQAVCWIAQQPAQLLLQVDIPGINIASRGIFVVRIFQFCFHCKGRKISHFQSAGDIHTGGISAVRRWAGIGCWLAQAREGVSFQEEKKEV